MMSIVSPLAQFNVHNVYSALRIEDASSVEAAAARCVYENMLKDARAEGCGEASRSTAVERAIDYMEKPLGFMRHYETSFFRRAEYDHDALTVAILCDGLVDKDSPGFAARDFRALIRDGRDDLRAQASGIVKRAEHFVDNGGNEYDMPDYEAVFCAKIGIFSSLSRLEGGLEMFGYDELEPLIRDDIPRWKSFLWSDTPLGSSLSAFMDAMAERVERMKPRCQIIQAPFAAPGPRPS